MVLKERWFLVKDLLTYLPSTSTSALFLQRSDPKPTHPLLLRLLKLTYWFSVQKKVLSTRLREFSFLYSDLSRISFICRVCELSVFCSHKVRLWQFNKTLLLRYVSPPASLPVLTSSGLIQISGQKLTFSLAICSIKFDFTIGVAASASIKDSQLWQLQSPWGYVPFDKSRYFSRVSAGKLSLFQMLFLGSEEACFGNWC